MGEAVSYLIVLPVRNGGQYLKPCVLSVLAQVGARFRLVVLDNASDDGSITWLKELNDPRITLLESDRPLNIEENWARIKSISSVGEYLTIIGHDDLLDAEFLSNMSALIYKNPNAKLYHSRFRLIDKYGRSIRDARSGSGIEWSHEFLAARMAFRRDSFGTGYVLKMQDYVAVGGIPQFKKLMFADDALWMRVMAGSYMATSEKVSFSYRVHAGSVSFSPDWSPTFDALRSYLELLMQQAAEDVKIREVVVCSIEKYLLYWLRWAYFSTSDRVRDRKSLAMAFAEIYELVESIIGGSKAAKYELRTRKNVFGQFGYIRWIKWRVLNRVRVRI
jgi:glycosyltransferase involved in cell wall biosynthesis